MRFRWILPGVLTVLCVLSAGCIFTDTAEPSVSKIEIITGGTKETVVITGASDIRHICDNLRSLELVKMEYNEPTALDCTLRFYDEAGILIESLEISSHDWIAYDGYFHYAGDGEFDRKFIDELVDAALSSGPKVIGD